MSLKIKANSFATKRILEVHSGGVTFLRDCGIWWNKELRVQSDRLCLSFAGGNLLSIQAGTEVVSLPMKTYDPKHRQVLETLLSHLQLDRSQGFPVVTYR